MQVKTDLDRLGFIQIRRGQQGEGRGSSGIKIKIISKGTKESVKLNGI